MSYAEKYSTSELMAAFVSRQIRNDDVVFIGIGLPLVAGVVAVATHAPKAILIYEGGGIGARTRRVPWSISDNPTTDNAIAAVPMWRVFSDMQAGYVTLGVVGGAEIDRFGNLNTTAIYGRGGSYRHPKVRLAGSGGANDIASSAGRLIIMMHLGKGKFVDRVQFLTTPGYISGPGAREEAGLKGKGPEYVVTEKCIFAFDEKTKEMYLKLLYPGVTVEEVKQLVGWDLKVAANMEKPEPPTEQQIRLMKAFDPDGSIMKTPKIAPDKWEDFDAFYELIKAAYESNHIYNSY